MTVPATTDSAVYDALVKRIKRIVPRYSPSRDKSWRWVGKGKRVAASPRVLRQFEVRMDAATAVLPRGAYGGGVQYQAPTVIRVAYPLSYQELGRFTSPDLADLEAMLVILHHDLEGMFPVSVDGRDQLLTSSRHTDKEQGYVIDYTVIPGLSFLASDQVTFAPEI